MDSSESRIHTKSHLNRFKSLPMDQTLTLIPLDSPQELLAVALFLLQPGPSSSQLVAECVHLIIHL